MLRGDHTRPGVTTFQRGPPTLSKNLEGQKNFQLLSNLKDPQNCCVKINIFDNIVTFWLKGKSKGQGDG